MKSEFSNFVTKIQVPLQRNPTLFEDTNYLYLNSQKAKDHLSYFYERILFIAHNIHDEVQLKNEVVQIQIMMTEFIDKHHRDQSYPPRILQKCNIFLQDLRKQFPKQFNNQVAYPSFAYANIEQEIHDKQQEILLLLKESQANIKLINILSQFFKNSGKQNFRNPSWQSVEYLIQILDEIKLIFQNKENHGDYSELNLVWVFIRNNFNKKPIIEYCVDQIHQYLCKPDQDEEEIIHYFLFVCNSMVYSGLVYDDYSISLQKQVETLLNARKRFLNNETNRRFKQNFTDKERAFTPLHVTEPSEITVLLFHLLFEVDLVKKPHNVGKFFLELSEFIRGPKGHQYKSSTLQKGVSVESLNHIDRMEEILQKMLKKLSDIRVVFLNKKVKKK